MGFGEAVWSDFGSKVDRGTRPVDLDGFRGDPGDPENPRKPRKFPKTPWNNAYTQIETTILKEQKQYPPPTCDDSAPGGIRC